MYMIHIIFMSYHVVSSVLVCTVLLLTCSNMKYVFHKGKQGQDMTYARKEEIRD